MAKLNLYQSDNSMVEFVEYIAIVTPDMEAEFNEDCVCDGLELKQSVELPAGAYNGWPTNRLMKEI